MLLAEVADKMPTVSESWLSAGLASVFLLAVALAWPRSCILLLPATLLWVVFGVFGDEDIYADWVRETSLAHVWSVRAASIFPLLGVLGAMVVNALRPRRSAEPNHPEQVPGSKVGTPG